MSQDAVVVTLSASPEGGMTAEVTWPANPSTPGGDYLYPTTVPLALDRARDVMGNHGFERVLVVLPEGLDWDLAWGELVEEG